MSLRGRCQVSPISSGVAVCIDGQGDVIFSRLKTTGYDLKRGAELRGAVVRLMSAASSARNQDENASYYYPCRSEGLESHRIRSLSATCLELPKHMLPDVIGVDRSRGLLAPGASQMQGAGHQGRTAPRSGLAHRHLQSELCVVRTSRPLA